MVKYGKYLHAHFRKDSAMSQVFLKKAFTAVTRFAQPALFSVLRTDCLFLQKPSRITLFPIHKHCRRLELSKSLEEVKAYYLAVFWSRVSVSVLEPE